MMIATLLAAGQPSASTSASREVQEEGKNPTAQAGLHIACILSEFQQSIVIVKHASHREEICEQALHIVANPDGVDVRIALVPVCLPESHPNVTQPCS